MSAITMNSLEHRLQVGLAISLIVLMALLGWAQVFVVQKLTENFIHSRLEHDSQSLLATLKFDSNGVLSITDSRLATVYTQPYSGHYYKIIVSDSIEPIRSRSLWDSSLEVPIPALGQTKTIQRMGPDSQSLLVHIASYQKQSHTITIAVAEDITPIQRQLRFYSLLFMGLAFTALLLLLLIQRIIVKISFQPLKQVHDEVLKLSEGQQGRLTEKVPDEVQPLVEAVNHLLSVMTQRLERSRNALGNLAHSLKSPLNLMTQLSADSRIKEYPEIYDEMQEHTSRMQQIINHELKRARLAGVAMPGQRFVPSRELPNLIKVLQQMYSDKSLTFDCDIMPGSFDDIDRDDMLELIGNLLDNSCKWAKSKIKCSISTVPKLAITVEDDGPGCSEKQLLFITERGIRVDESVSGHGLGLTIVKEISQIYHLNLQLDRSPELGG
ncbi:MAG: sensor histidine kinase [Gammaproteobacteria bacterium]|nr:sensor histidine kinase [Gammaproteobacteria bacterium]